MRAIVEGNELEYARDKEKLANKKAVEKREQDRYEREMRSYKREQDEIMYARKRNIENAIYGLSFLVISVLVFYVAGTIGGIIIGLFGFLCLYIAFKFFSHR